MSERKEIYLTVDRDGLTKGLQVSIEARDNSGAVGYRIAGPKYNGSSTTLIRHKLSHRDVEEISRYLERAKATVDQATPTEG